MANSSGGRAAEGSPSCHIWYKLCQGLCRASAARGNSGSSAVEVACVCWWRLCACCCTGRPLGMGCGDLAQLLAGPLGWAADALFKALGGRPADAPEMEAENLAAETAEETWAAARAALPKLYAGPLLAAAGLQGDMQNGSVSRLRPAGEAQAAHCQAGSASAQGHWPPGCTAFDPGSSWPSATEQACSSMHSPVAASAVWHAWHPHDRQAVHQHTAPLCQQHP